MIRRLRLTQQRRDATLVLLAILLLATPFLIGQLHFDDSVHRYERIEVTTEDGTVQYAQDPLESDVDVPISDGIGCTYYHYRSDERYCTLENSLARNDHRVISAWATGPSPIPETSEYAYLAVNGSVYEPTLAASETPEPDRAPNDQAVYPIYLDLDPVRAETALRRVSVPVNQRYVSGPLRRAATTGQATVRGGVTVPSGPFRLENGSYYRVYQSDVSDPPTRDRAIYLLGRYLAPLLGIGALYVVSGNVTVGYTGGRSGPDRDS